MWSTASDTGGKSMERSPHAALSLSQWNHNGCCYRQPARVHVDGGLDPHPSQGQCYVLAMIVVPAIVGLLKTLAECYVYRRGQISRFYNRAACTSGIPRLEALASLPPSGYRKQGGRLSALQARLSAIAIRGRVSCALLMYPASQFSLTPSFAAFPWPDSWQGERAE